MPVLNKVLNYVMVAKLQKFLTEIIWNLFIWILASFRMDISLAALADSLFWAVMWVPVMSFGPLILLHLTMEPFWPALLGKD